MAETYCGKSCSECEYQEALGCPGCKAGPGKQYAAECRLAKCCRDKGHSECATCEFCINCNTLRSRERIPEERLKRIENEKARKAAIAARAPFLGKWLWVLFWLIVPGTVASCMSIDYLRPYLPGLYTAGLVLNAVTSALYGIILLRLAAEEDRYRTAGICVLISAAVSALIFCIAGGDAVPGWTLLLSLPASVVSFVGKYNEFTAHSIVLTGVDNELSWKWTVLWKWFIGSFCAVFGSILVLVILPILGLLVMLAAAIAFLVVGIVQLVYLYKTASLFRNYSID